MTGGPVTDDEVARELAGHPAWRRGGRTLVRTTRMRDFEDALAFVERIGATAVDYGRRPDMCISEFNRVRLLVSNLHHAGFTQAEMRLVAKGNEVIRDDLPDAWAAGE